ncbi:cytochrome P450 [Stutzerimonas nitrititolerans]|uniref:Cytochrome P450 n=1 Tax=Stutzerimonas nitrititolerans TaxID=2482751 RepID=A0AA42BEL4_9GAMM|nr:cytochrome P450 [Stutzerimonas nitrititolerans]MCO7545349.1 cytochrome P450 [Stutzerimonas nitrititolerans]
MSEEPKSDWDPRSADALADQIAAYDALRARCPVAYSDYLQWSLLRHADVMQVLLDHETFSSAVSSYPSVPNGMDPPEHGLFRRLIEPYFAPPRMQAFEPLCRAIASELAAALPKAGDVELIDGFAQDFALRIQCAFMGWPGDLHEPLRQWTRKNHRATLAGAHAAKAEVALEFDGYIRGILEARRAEDHLAGDDPTDRLLAERIEGRPLSDEEIVSILRNWTVGELGTIAASVGIVTHYLAARPELQRQLRQDLSLLPAAIDEILRIDAPLIANRRITTRAVELGGRRIEAGERLTLLWASANRDEDVFDDPDAFRLDRDPSLNLLYGAGIHVCPGAPLARLELRVVMEELLRQTLYIALVPDQPPVRACYPAGGFSELPLRIG